MSGVDPVFEQVLGTAPAPTPTLFVLQSTSADKGWSAFLLLPPAPTGTTVSIADSFNTYAGHYLFADKPPPLSTPALVQAFVDGILTYVAQFGSNATVCLWIPDPAGLNFGPQPPTSWGFSFSAGLNVTQLQTNFNHALGRRITFSAQINAIFSLAPGNLGLRLRSTGGSTQLGFTTSPNDGLGPTISPQSTIIPFTGAYRGCILAGGTIPAALMLPFFTAGLRYAHAAGTGTVQQIYPVVRYDIAPGVSVPYAGSVDPLDTFNDGPLADPPNGALRTLFALSPGMNTVLPAWLRMQTGKPLALVPVGATDANGGPQPNAGALIFGKYDGSASDPLYLTYAGDFGLAVDGTIPAAAVPRAELICGLYGTEALSFRPFASAGQNDVLRFVANKPAYAPVFPFPRASLENASAGKPQSPLDATMLTSWATIVPGDSGPISYSAQPEGSALFHVGDAPQSSPAVTVLSSYPPGTEFAEVVPLVPYAGLPSAAPGFPPGDIVPFETQIIAPERKRIVAAPQIRRLTAVKRMLRRGALFADTAPVSTTTPQGLLAELAGGQTDPQYTSVTLARSVAAVPDMAFYNCEPALQSALQTNQLFLVAVDRTHLGPPPDPNKPHDHAFADSVTIEDWTMRVRVGQGVSASDYRNVFIMKFCEGTLLERITNPQKWTATEDFSLASHDMPPEIALSGLSQWLQGYCADALKLADAGNVFYKNFARIVRDPNWKGILALRVDLDVTSLPEQLSGLAAGIDLTQFVAHHVGIAVSRVVVDGKTVTLAGPSSMFGLIDYELPAYRAALAAGVDRNNPIALSVSGPFGFTVLQLTALFENSALVDLQSAVQLTMNQFFGSPVTANFSAAGSFPINAVVLNGTYQKQGAASVYVFEQNRRIVFALGSNVLQAVAVSRAQFNAQSAPKAEQKTTLESRFLLSGMLDFTVLQTRGDDAGKKTPEDVLSFGSPPATPQAQLGTGLSFAGLAIELASPVATPSTIAYTFNAGNLAFDLATSTAREGSLFTGFGLQIRDFIAASPDKRPPDYGFLTVQPGQLAVKTLDQPWFGIAYKVTMGTPGALVSSAGFDSALLVAWSPSGSANEANAPVFIGLALPGAAPGAKLISLQGVLKVTVASIDLLYGPITGHPATMGYNLRLNNIGLTFLGLVKLPPGATINFFLFGDPEGRGSLGWYAAYVEDQKKQPPLALDDAPPYALAEESR